MASTGGFGARAHQSCKDQDYGCQPGEASDPAKAPPSDNAGSRGGLRHGVLPVVAGSWAAPLEHRSQRPSDSPAHDTGGHGAVDGRHKLTPWLVDRHLFAAGCRVSAWLNRRLSRITWRTCPHIRRIQDKCPNPDTAESGYKLIRSAGHRHPGCSATYAPLPVISVVSAHRSLFTRTGPQGIRQVNVRGMVATAFTRAPPAANHPRSSCAQGAVVRPIRYGTQPCQPTAESALPGWSNPGCVGERLRAAHAPSSPLRQTLRVNYVSLILPILAIGISLASLIRHGADQSHRAANGSHRANGQPRRGPSPYSRDAGTQRRLGRIDAGRQ